MKILSNAKAFILGLFGYRYCPKCNYIMKKGIEHGMKVYKCRSCGGMIILDFGK